jgi:hypothetical protein
VPGCSYFVSPVSADWTNPRTHAFFTGSNCLTTLAGFPKITEYGGKLRVTTAFAPTTQLRLRISSPLVHTMAAPWPIREGNHSPVLAVSHRQVEIGGTLLSSIHRKPGRALGGTALEHRGVCSG